MTPAPSIANIAAALAQARSAAADGARVDLDGLVAVVEEAMRRASTAPLVERPALAAEMLSLLKELDTLATTLARQHHAEAQRRAAAAYGPSGAANRTDP
jgi:hypothetical protein